MPGPIVHCTVPLAVSTFTEQVTPFGSVVGQTAELATSVVQTLPLPDGLSVGCPALITRVPVDGVPAGLV